MSNVDKSTNEAWQRHWQGERISSSFDDEPHVAQDWGKFFGGVKDGASILDLCTGNGVVPLIAIKTAKEAAKTFNICGIDQAEIDPGFHVASERALLEEIDFQGGVDAAELPFDSESFDVITSQHGLEYTDWKKTITGIVRVLKPGGIGRFVIHAASGEIVNHNRPKIIQCEAVLSARVFEKAQKAIELAWDVEKGRVPANRRNRSIADKAARDLGDSMKKLNFKFSGSPHQREFEELFKMLSQAYQGRGNFGNESQMKTWIKANRAELSDQRLRLMALLAAAKDQAGISDMAEAFDSCGLKVDEPVTQLMPGSEALIGYVINVAKAT